MKGLRNLGNTCYLNAALQCLAHVRILVCYVKYCKNDYLYGNEKSTHVLREFGRLVDKLWTRDDSVDSLDPWHLLERLRSENELFDGFAQQDLHEALLEIVDLAKLDTMPALRGVFTGVMEVRVTCGSCGKYQQKEDPFIGLSVPFEDTLEDCLQSFEASLVPDWACDVCKQMHDATAKRLKLVHLPEVLPLHVKRFEADGSKIRGHVKFGETLKLGKAVYELVGVATHLGDVLGYGHYVARCRVQNGLWVEFDDSKCYRIQSVETVLNSEAYLLMYQRLPAARDLEPRLLGGDMLMMDDADEFYDKGVSENDWVVPAVWWLRFRTFARCEQLTDADWAAGGSLVVVDERTALHVGALRRADYIRLRVRENDKNTNNK